MGRRRDISGDRKSPQLRVTHGYCLAHRPKSGKPRKILRDFEASLSFATQNQPVWQNWLACRAAIAHALEPDTLCTQTTCVFVVAILTIENWLVLVAKLAVFELLLIVACLPVCRFVEQKLNLTAQDNRTTGANANANLDQSPAFTTELRNRIWLNESSMPSNASLLSAIIESICRWISPRVRSVSCKIRDGRVKKESKIIPAIVPGMTPKTTPVKIRASSGRGKDSMPSLLPDQT